MGRIETKEGWTFPDETEKCLNCPKKLMPKYLVQGRCPTCHDKWMDAFIDGRPFPSGISAPTAVGTLARRKFDFE